jgi:hypothetical protein
MDWVGAGWGAEEDSEYTERAERRDAIIVGVLSPPLPPSPSAAANTRSMSSRASPMIAWRARRTVKVIVE